MLQEILTKAGAGATGWWRNRFTYLPRRHGSSHARVFKFGLVYLQSLYTLWAYRNSLQSADYEARAFYSRIPLQRWWQRRRCLMLRDFIGDRMRVLDIGCGSSQLLNKFPRRWHGHQSRQTAFHAATRANADQRVRLCPALPRQRLRESLSPSQLVEHLPGSDEPFAEMARCLEPGGTLIIGRRITAGAGGALSNACTTRYSPASRRTAIRQNTR